MAVIATVNPLNQFFALNGAPLNNGKLYFGEVSEDPEQNPVQMYWDAAGLVPALQPIRTTSGYPSRSGSPAILYCASEYSLRVLQSNDVQVFYLPRAGSPALQTLAQWEATGVTPLYASANSFTLTGDQTEEFEVGRRARFTVTAGYVYGSILTSVYGALTTVTMDMDGSEVLDAGLSAVDLSILTASNSAVPSTIARSGANDDITSMTALESINILPGYLFGCTMSTAGTSTTMSIAAGRATNSTGVRSMSLSAIAKTTSNWAVGTAAGGKSLAAAIANNTWYHFYMINRPDTGVVDVCFSTNATGLVAADFVAGGGNVPDAYTQFRRIGSMRTNGSAQWESFVQDGDLFNWSSPANDFTVSNPTTSAVLRTLKTPLGINTTAILNVSNSGTTISAFYFSDPGTTDIAATDTNAQVTLASSSTFANCQIQIRTNTSSQIRTRASASDASTSMRGTTTGYIDRRGRDA